MFLRWVALMLAGFFSLASAEGPYKVTGTSQAIAPENSQGGPASTRPEPWYINQERTIWLYGGVPWVANQPLKVAWFRPSGRDLQVSGRRLDADAPPLAVEIGSGRQYRHRFLPSLLTFPCAGFWEIEAESAGQKLRLVVQVNNPQAGSRLRNRSYAPSTAASRTLRPHTPASKTPS